MSGKGVRKSNGFSSICVYLVCDCANRTGNYEDCWRLGTATSSASDYSGIHCRTNAGRMVVMKIDELVNTVRAMNSSTDAYKYPDEIKVVFNSFTIVNIPYDAKNMFDCLFVNQNLEVPIDVKARLTGIINKFLRTPIKDRFPEKKYRLRWIDDEDGGRNYLFTTSGWYLTNIIHDKKAVFTESELEQLKRDAPRLAPAIDAMKEPVEED